MVSLALRLGILALFLAALGDPGPGTPDAGRAEVVRIVAFSDYHSHAVPFFSEGRLGQGGVARAVALFEKERRDPRTVIVSGGDMLSRGAPAWSDEFGCVEWPWLAGLVDVMALGNHDLDYGPDAFFRCRASASFPVLSANLVGADGRPALTTSEKPYLVKVVSGVRVGFFALGGADMPSLVRKENLPPGTHWTDPTEAARAMVHALRDVEKVSAVVLIGHQAREDDEALARSVAGIDLVLGTHSHHKSELLTIPGTTTAYIAPYQYLAYVSRVSLEFREGRLAGITGALAPIDASLPDDPKVAAEVERLQRALRARRPDRFRVVGRTAAGLSDADVMTGASEIGSWATERLRRAAHAHACLATASSFRGGLPPGEIRAEDFYTAIPYKNAVVVATMTGRGVTALVRESVSRRESDLFSQESGLRYTIEGALPRDIQILRDPERPQAGYAPLDETAAYRIATSDFQAQTARGYREIFAGAIQLAATGLDAQEILLAALAEGVGPGAGHGSPDGRR